MADDLEALEDWVAPLIEKLETAERRKLARTIGNELRRSQRQRIRSQKNPDGTPYEPRRRLRDQSGRIRRKAMFGKITAARYLKVRTTPDAVSVGFFGRVARIAAVHQYGLTEKVDRNGPAYDYPARVLLGHSDADRELVRDLLIDHLSKV